MKKLYLFLVALGITTSLFAQNESRKYEPNVIIGGKGKHEMSAKEEKKIIKEAMHHFQATQTSGFQQSHLPQFVITGRDNKFLLGIGGFVNFRTAYDFDGVVQNTDFVTYDIPIPGSYATKQQFRMDASTSRLFFKAIANTKALGRIVTYIETDFRGYNHSLRLRYAYIAFKGWLFGQNATTFCDLNASPTTIDFEGPNAYTFGFNTMIRYTHSFNKHWSIGAALEMPQISATTTEQLRTIPQRLPDLPIYLQVNWGKHGASHIRASAVFRDLYYYSTLSDKNKSVFGWGVQLSTGMQISRNLTFYGQALYGKGITPYIQDIAGVGLDLVPDPRSDARLQVLPMFGWFGSLQYNFTKNFFCSGGYSQVRLFSENGYRDANPNSYRLAQYVFANMFYNITPNCQIGIEYLYGTRRNMDLDMNHANRIQSMIQYNF